jgi:hypothetical protein
MLGKAISTHFALPDDEDILFLRSNTKLPAGVPRITVIHDDRPMLKAPGELAQSKAKYRHKKVIFLVRDPRDVIVSSYFEMNKRGHIFGTNPYEARQAVFGGSLPAGCTLSAFIHTRVGGFDTILRYYNIWANNRYLPRGFLLVRYEDMKADSGGELRRVLDFVGLTTIDMATIAQAVEFASFDNMRKMEAENRFQSGILNPGENDDQESYKTRRGNIGGYREYLSQDEIDVLDHKIKDELSPYFGYKSQS